jgi:hypothetical protein
VTGVVPVQSFTWIARGLGIVATGRHVVIPTSREGEVKVTASLEQSGPLGLLMGLLTKRLTDHYLQTEVRGLKARCEM